MNDLTSRQVLDLNNLNTNTQAMKFGEKIQQLIDEVNDSLATGTPVNAVNAS